MASAQADPLNYQADTDDLAAFRLLVHAELEEYLENKAKDGLDGMENAFKNGKKAIRDNFALIVIASAMKTELRFDANHWETDVHSTLKSARSWISDNNGIKEASFTILSLFSGKMPDEVDPSLAASLNSYGKARGDVAHRSVQRVKTIYSPIDEAKSANDLISALDAYFA